ncbi:MAG TPA: PIN domain-containing protein [Thermodesulfobacteriota bacterium]|nr:PIN domain-containing protein [Thermodesulfobacteriota bacterium]
MNALGLWILRILLFVICGIGGYAFTREIAPTPFLLFLGLISGLLLAALTLLIEKGLKQIPLKNLLGSFIGFILGILVANLLSNAFLPYLLDHQQIVLPLFSVLYGVCGYMGLRIGFRKGEEIRLSGWKFFSKGASHSENAKILDTSVIIDGRIADITETGFIEGALVIPQFVLNELQHIADSSDSIKRTRGKRGLEVLHHIQKQAIVDVQIVDRDYPSVKEVDSKLIELAKEVRGKIITNDSNLNKVAELQGIQVLNINELANSIKPVVLPGEEINVKILKEGKETGQGVAYLDDGTMIVVDNGRRHMGKTIDVIVTSVLQTPAGRMIFARLKEEATRESKGKDYYYPLDSEF